MPTNPKQIADGLSEEARLSLIEGCSCGHAQELVDAGLWESVSPPGYKQEYFALTETGLAVRAYLQEQSR